MAKWRLLGSETVLSTPWLSIHKNKYKVEEGRIVDDYYVIKRDNFVLVIATKGDKLILVQQYRPATDQFYLALPAGYLKHDESPEVAGKRELLEETGYSANRCRLIGELHPMPGYIQSAAHVVLCEEVSKSNTRDIDFAEINEVVEVLWTKVSEMIVQSRINEMQAVAAILFTREFLLKQALTEV